MKEIFNQWGFKGATDYFATLFGLKITPFMSAQLLGTFATASFAFCADWIWNPPWAIVFVVALSIANARYGILVSLKIKKETFDWKKFKKTLSIAASDMLLMSFVHSTIKLIPALEFIADVFLGWIIWQRATAVYGHMEQLQLQSGGLIQFMKRRIFRVLEDKIGADMVDNIQNKEHPKEEILNENQNG